MTAIRLNEREAAALLALRDPGRPVTGRELAHRMTLNGRETEPAGADQSGAGLDRKGLAVKTWVNGETGLQVGYEITDEGRKAAAGLRSGS